jgi:hypothetical protein
MTGPNFHEPDQGPDQARRDDVALRRWQVQESPGVVTVDDTSWPVDGDEVSIEWKLRYGAPELLTRSDLLFAAEVLAAYRAIACGPTLGESMAKMRRARRAHMDVVG